MQVASEWPMVAGMSTLTDSELRILRDLLVRKEAALIAQIDSACALLSDARAPRGAEVLDSKEHADHCERNMFCEAEARRVRGELQQARAALVRIEKGSYGDCVDCCESMDLRRLIAMPEALRCLSCQTRFESHARLHAIRPLPGPGTQRAAAMS